MRRLAAMLAAVAVGVSSSPVLTAPAHAASDADQVRAVLDGMNGSYNRSDFASFAAHVCAAMRNADGFRSEWYASRRADGPTRISVDSVTVAGHPTSSAVATVRFAAENRPSAKTFDIDFVREGSEWKACHYHPTQAA
ncbi:hypothetical protein A5765_05985 [Mycolicibacterium celeriflavum]|uniref:Rv0361 family membrane protein n=1 Tax=Mycolicibacterium celeriflavum TaxID=1249101 RepID=UPI0007FDDF33|nr:hypothetical protein [Mycolicibacterium celeriflavum]OBG17654.1 hypothetical protein A5765_05985 [Mycolicibacterium celeriflavum]